MMFWPYHDLTGWGWAAMGISMLLFWAVLIGAGVLLVRTLDRPNAGPPPAQRPSAEELLAERFARGEIDEQEYRRCLATLTEIRQAAHLSAGSR
jgi:putative membrane protein